MFDQFGDYMFYLLNAPLKKLKDGRNQLKIFFSVAGKIFDGMLQDILKFQRQKVISEAEPIMLEVIGQDRDMFLLQGETTEQYRHRLQMKAILSELGGTNTGLLLALQVLGYPDCVIEPLYKTDRSRWAEIYIDILVTHDINYAAILYEVLRIKTARTLPYFRFKYHIQSQRILSVAVGGLGNCIKIKARVTTRITAENEDKDVSALFLNQNILIKANDKIKKNQVYVAENDNRIRVLTGNGSVVQIK